MRLGLSRTPVREALARLADIGLVEAEPGVCTRITTLNRRDVEKTLAVLRSLDQFAVETAVPAMTEQDLQRMRQANRDFERAVAADDTDAALAADDRDVQRRTRHPMWRNRRGLDAAGERPDHRRLTRRRRPDRQVLVGVGVDR